MVPPRLRPDFNRHFEGKEVLEGLLQACGNCRSAEDTLELMRESHSRGDSANQLIPTLFDGEPRFPDPSYAQRLYQNLLGLWDLVSSGKSVSLEAPEKPPRRPAQPAPGRFGPQGPDVHFVENAWRYLEDLDNRARNRLQHAFENRQDNLVGFLEEQGLSDAGFDCAYQLVFELFSMIELGWPPGTRPIARSSLERGGKRAQQVPAALREYVDEALFEAEQDEQEPLSREESAKVRAAAMECLSALWAARRGA